MIEVGRSTGIYTAAREFVCSATSPTFATLRRPSPMFCRTFGIGPHHLHCRTASVRRIGLTPVPMTDSANCVAAAMNPGDHMAKSEFPFGDRRHHRNVQVRHSRAVGDVACNPYRSVENERRNTLPGVSCIPSRRSRWTVRVPLWKPRGAKGGAEPGKGIQIPRGGQKECDVRPNFPALQSFLTTDHAVLDKARLEHNIMSDAKPTYLNWHSQLRPLNRVYRQSSLTIALPFRQYQCIVVERSLTSKGYDPCAYAILLC